MKKFLLRLIIFLILLFSISIINSSFIGKVQALNGHSNYTCDEGATCGFGNNTLYSGLDSFDCGSDGYGSTCTRCGFLDMAGYCKKGKQNNKKSIYSGSSGSVLELATDPILKPLRFDHPGDTSPDNYPGIDSLGKSSSDPEAHFNPVLINEGDTSYVDVYFPLTTAPPSSTELDLCYKGNIQDCTADTDNMHKVNQTDKNQFGLGDSDKDVQQRIHSLFPIVSVNPSADNIIKNTVKTRVCGTGSTDLKAGDDCKDDNGNYGGGVWFHGGMTHHVTLWQKTGNSYVQLADAAFYVYRYYPNVFISIPQTPSKDPNNLPDTGVVTNLVASASLDNNWIRNHLPGINDQTGEVQYDMTNKPPQSIAIRLTGLKLPNDDGDYNDYKINVKGLDGKYEQNQCVTLSDPSLEYADAPSFVFSGLHAGNYEIDISEETNEGHNEIAHLAAGAPEAVWWAVGGDTQGIEQVMDKLFPRCDSGFVYWRIVGTYESNVDPSSSSQFPYNFTVTDVEKDPDGIETAAVGKIIYPTKPVPCDPKFYDPDSGLCSEVPTALGDFPTDPAKLMISIFQIILQLGGVLAVFFLIISGYTVLTSQGDKQKLAAARERITATLIGLIFIIFSLVLVQYLTTVVLNLPGFK